MRDLCRAAGFLSAVVAGALAAAACNSPSPDQRHITRAASSSTPEWPTASSARPAGGAPVPISITFVSARRGWVLAHDSQCLNRQCRATIFRSTNGGRSWTRVGAPNEVAVNGGARDGAVSSLQFVNRQVGFAFGGDLWRTTNGGRTWRRLAMPVWRMKGRSVGQPTVTSLSVEGGVALMVGEVCDTAGQQCQLGALYKAGRSGPVRRVRDLPRFGRGGGFFDGVVSVDHDTPYFSVIATGGVARLYSRRGGKWLRRRDPCGHGGGSDGLVADGSALIDVCTGYINPDQGTTSVAFLSMDGGTTWQRGGGIGDAKAVSSPLRIRTDVYAADDESGGHIYRSSDGGRDWSTVRSLARSKDGWSSLDSPDRNEAFAVTGGRRPRIYVTRDAGSAWRRVTLP